MQLLDHARLDGHRPADEVHVRHPVLGDDLLQHIDDSVRGAVVSHEERAWASVTFAGARHRVVLEFSGQEAVSGGETLIAELPEHEFTLPRQLVADATVLAADHRLLPEPRLRVECELLLVEDG